MYLLQLIIMLFVFILPGALLSGLEKYCDLDCTLPFAKHIVCNRLNVQCGPDSRCRNFEVLPMTDAFRQLLQNKHNALRNKVALGQEKRGPQPKAANMNVLNWNKELEFIAQCLANTCEMMHDECRRTENLSVGQNIAYQGQQDLSGLKNVKTSISLIQTWYDEVKYFNPMSIQRFTRHDKTGHYTQIVWAETEYLGCAAALYTEDMYNILLVCNYGGAKSGGNMMRRSIYQIGEPCSECPANKLPNKKYKGLCGKSYIVNTLNKIQNPKKSAYYKSKYRTESSSTPALSVSIFRI